MKPRLSIVILFAFYATSTLAQKKDEVNFSDPYQIDSSEYFMIPRLVDNDNKGNYGKGKGYLPWGNYNEVFFYNSSTKQTKKLFSGQLALIQPLTTQRYNYSDHREPDTPRNILPNHIIWLARTDNFNNDNGLDTEDPQYLFISTKTGELKQVTPKGLNVVSWTLSKDKKMILVKLQNDKDGDKKFGNGDDELYYRIDLHPDISKIECYQVDM